MTPFGGLEADTLRGGLYHHGQMQSSQLEQLFSDFLVSARNAVVVEDGEVLFDLATARYTLSGENGRCVLHMWSPERNVVRRVIDAELKNDTLRLAVQRFGQAKPVKFELWRDRDRRTPTARRSARIAYKNLLKRVLERQFFGLTIERLTTDMDLERSFGPAYARGLIRQGKSAFAVLGVNAQEPQATIDAALTFGILWLDLCRERASRAYVEGLKLYLPRGTSAVVRERIAHLDEHAAKWQIYELDERTGEAIEMDCADRGNIETRLVHAPDTTATLERFADPVARIMSLVPQAEVAVLSSAEITFRLHGLEFARAEVAPSATSFRNAVRVVFGTGANETELTEVNEDQFAELVRRVAELRQPGAARNNAVWRMCPERWLESLVVQNVTAIDERLDPACVYSQVPAFTAADRAMIDVLTCTKSGRLALIELKADEDMHLPLQAVDYWSRVVWHQQRGEFQRFGYFPGRELSTEPPLLLLVAPALRIHSTIDTVLRYIAPEINATLVAVDERWREGVRVVFRKRRNAGVRQTL